MIRKWGAVTGTGHHKLLGERDGQERSRIGTAGAEGPVVWDGKISTLVRYVLVYMRFYRRRLGRQAGGSTSDPFRNV